VAAAALFGSAARAEELGVKAAPVGAQVSPFRVELPWLWQEPELPRGVGRADVTLRGWDDNERRRFRPGLEKTPDGFTSYPHLLPEGGPGLKIRIQNDVAAGALIGENVDADSIIADYPATRPRHLLGNTGGYRNRIKAEASGSYHWSRISYYLQAIDERESWTYLGATEAETVSRPRYTLNLGWLVTPRTRVTLGARYDAILTDNYGLSAWDFASAARDRGLHEAHVVLTARHQLSPRHELSALLSFTHFREDHEPRGGIDTPGHDNLDTYEYWGNYFWRKRFRDETHFVDLRWSGFWDGLLHRSDAHTVTLGAQLEVEGHEADKTRTGGFTFVDLAADGPGGQPLDGIDENDRGTWRLASSDRGDELHAKTRQASVALYLQDRLQLGSRVTVTPGVRLEHTSAGFVDGTTAWSTTTLAPRVSGVVDLTRDGRFRLFTGYGRHYQQVDFSMIARARAGAAYSPLEYWDWQGDPGTSAPPGRDDARWVRAKHFPALIGTLDDIEQPHVDRVVVGLGKTIEAIRLQLRLGYELVRQRNMVAIYDEGASVHDAADNPEGSYDLKRYTAGGGEEVTYYDLRPGARPDFRVGNPEGAWRDRHRITFGLRNTFFRFLTVTGELTFTDDRGNLDALGGLSREWRDPNGRTNAEGRMPGHDTLELDLGATFYLPWRFDLDIDYTFRSGGYYSRYFRIRPQNGPRTYVYDDAGRGGYQLPARHLLDVELRRRLPIPGPGRWKAWVQAKNLLNAATVTEVKEQSTIFRRVKKIERPREIYLGIRYEL
jgi:hypothetical protein